YRTPPTSPLSRTSLTAARRSTLTLQALPSFPTRRSSDLTGTGTSATHTTSVTLTVSPPNNFSIAANPTSLSLVQGASGTSTISTAVTSTRLKTSHHSVTYVPCGATATLSPTSVTAGGSST